MSNFPLSETLSVSDLNHLAKTLLETELSGLWISGEVSNLTRAASGHYYFSLKDSKAQVRCVLFKGYAEQLDFRLKEGDEIELSGKITLYEARGEFQISVTSLRQTGLGQLFERYEAVKKKLTAEGLFLDTHKKALPTHPKAIGIVTSLAAAALRDVVTTLRRRMSAIPVIVYPTAVQGRGSENEIAKAIETANQRNEVDVIIVCRGGGSIEDLWAFNEEVTVRAIAASDLPIVTGVGHETDFTLSDFVSDRRAPTPTAAAEFVSPNREELWRHVQNNAQKIQHFLFQKYSDGSQKLDALARQCRHPKERCLQQQKALSTLQNQLKLSFNHMIYSQNQYFQHQKQIFSALKPDIASATHRLMQLDERLNYGYQQFFIQKLSLLNQQQQLIETLSPQATLDRGYSVVYDHKGRVVKAADALRLGQTIRIAFAKGHSQARIIEENRQVDLFEGY